MKLFNIKYLYLLVGCLVLFSCNSDDEILSTEDEMLFYEVSNCEGYDYLFHADEMNLLIKRGEGKNLDYIIFNFNGEDEYLIDYDSFNRPQYIKMGDCWVHLCNYEGNKVDALVFKNNEYVTSLENIYTEVDWYDSRLNTVQSRNMDAALESLKEDWNFVWLGIGIGVKTFAPVTKMLLSKGLYTPLDMVEEYVSTAIDFIEDFSGENFEKTKLTLALYESSKLLNELDNSPIEALKTLASNYISFNTDKFYEKQKDDLNKMYSSRFVGPWDYRVNNGSPFEIVFLKNGTFIDYFDFHTSGYYKYDWITGKLVMKYIYAGERKEDYYETIIECSDVTFSSREIKYSLPNGNVILMVKKDRSDYYTGNYDF